jgi:gliding motility-associated-like protein
VWINQLLPVEVTLGDDIELLIGDSVTIQAVVNIPIDSLSEITWHGIDTTNCATCLTQIVAPLMTTGYAIEVITHEGCIDRDSMNVTVLAGSDFYIPNIFSPNDDGANDHFIFYVGNEIERISMVAIYDRWGGVMFLMEDRLPDDPQLFWDGRSNGVPCTPGVYVYRIAAVLTNRESIIKTGSLTLVR